MADVASKQFARLCPLALPRASGIQNLARELEPRFYAQLAEQIGDVKLDGLGRAAQRLRDLFVGFSLDALAHHFSFFVGVTTANTPVGWAPVGVGGRAEYNFPGRLLTDLIPINSVGGAGATVYSKDHDLVEGNQTDVWAMSVQGF